MTLSLSPWFSQAEEVGEKRSPYRHDIFYKEKILSRVVSLFFSRKNPLFYRKLRLIVSDEAE
jgi:hypothetical protein